jgi:hypothetical protein
MVGGTVQSGFSDRLHLGPERGGLHRFVADLRAALPGVPPATDQVRLEGRQVDEQEVIAQAVQHPARALEVDADLIRALLRAHVHGRDHVGINHSIGVLTVVLLEGFHRLDQRGVVARGVANAACSQVAAGA